MSTIISETTFIEDGTRKYFVLNNQQYLRKIKPIDWSSMTIGMLCSIEATSSFTGGLAIGLMSSKNYPGNVGINNPLSQISRSIYSAAGMYYPNSSYWDLIYDSSDPSGSKFTSKLISCVSITHGVRSTGGNIHSYYLASHEYPYRKVVFSSYIDKYLLTTLSCKLYVAENYSGSYNKNHTDNVLEDVILSRPYPIINDQGVYPLGGVSLNTYDPINYPMDTICIAATGSYKLRIYEIGICTRPN